VGISDDDGGLATLLDEIIRSPDDLELRLAYADAVEAADAERAELIRIQVRTALTRGAHWPPDRRALDEAEVYGREQGLVYRRGREWAASIAGLASSWHFLRGFPEEIGIDAADFLARAPELYRRAPVLHLNLRGVLPVIEEFFGSPYLSQIRSMWMVRQGFADEDAAVIARSPYLGNLEWMDLGANHIGAAGLDALAASDRLPRLGYLGFLGNKVDDPTPRFADDYDADTPVARQLQEKYGPREWLSARPRSVWPPYRDAVWKRYDALSGHALRATPPMKVAVRGTVLGSLSSPPVHSGTGTTPGGSSSRSWKNELISSAECMKSRAAV